MTTQTYQPAADPWDEPGDIAPSPTLRVVPTPSDAVEPAGTTWEYLTAHGGTNSNDAQVRLNALGLEGWELVSVVPPHDPSGQTVLYLKRPRTR